MNKEGKEAGIWGQRLGEMTVSKKKCNRITTFRSAFPCNKLIRSINLLIYTIDYQN